MQAFRGARRNEACFDNHEGCSLVLSSLWHRRRQSVWMLSKQIAISRLAKRLTGMIAAAAKVHRVSAVTQVDHGLPDGIGIGPCYRAHRGQQPEDPKRGGSHPDCGLELASGIASTEDACSTRQIAAIRVFVIKHVHQIMWLRYNENILWTGATGGLSLGLVVGPIVRCTSPRPKRGVGCAFTDILWAGFAILVCLKRISFRT
jgi:hypothetical protein